MCRVLRRLVQALVEGTLHIPISLGSTQAAREEASAAVDVPCQELEQASKHQPVLNGDETGHRNNAAKRRLWALVAPGYVYYTIAHTRGADVLVQVLGKVFVRLQITKTV